MKSSKNCKVTAAFLAAAALGGVAHAEPTLNMNDLVGTSTSAESTTQSPTSVVTPVVKPMATQPVLPTTPQPATIVQQQTPPMVAGCGCNQQRLALYKLNKLHHCKQYRNK